MLVRRRRIGSCYPILWAGLAAIGLGGAARADVITDWAQTAEDALKASTTPNDQARTLTIMHTAMFDAVNGVDQRYMPYHVPPAAQPGASRRAAAAQAAYTVLVTFVPDQKMLLDDKLADTLAAAKAQPDYGVVEDDAAIAGGTDWGMKVANAILDWRKDDGVAKQLPPFTGSTAPGQWRPTPPKFQSATNTQLPASLPWAMTSASQFRVGPPPALTSDLYAADLNEVKAIGRKDSATRTPEQTAIAQFWLAPGYKFNINLAFHNIGLQAALAHPATLVDNARMFAMLEMVQEDAIVAAEDSKYTYDFWRPITAIQNADQDGNPATEADPNWTPYQDTVPNPDYPSNAGILGSSFAGILEAFYGDSFTYTIRSGNLPDAPRTFTSFSALVEEFGNARVYQGVHFPNSVHVGEAMGKALAEYITTSLMQPRHDVVTDWAQIAEDAIKASKTVTDQFRLLTIVHGAMFDAVNGIDQRYVPYHVPPAAQFGASRRTAVVQAAYTALVALLPDVKALLDGKLADSLAAIKAQPDFGVVEDDAAIANGVNWGTRVANAILDWRKDDGYAKQLPPFTGGTAPGQWRPTPPKFQSATNTQLPTALPWAMTSNSQFRVGPPPALTSDLYAADLNEVKAVGRKDSTTRTPEQTAIAQFWLAPGFKLNANVVWHNVGLQAALARPRSLTDNARMFVMLQAGHADAIIAAEDSKYIYDFWRPITAIQNADQDGNPATEADPNWAPLQDTVPNPDYPSNAGILGGAGAGILAAFYGDSFTFTIQSGNSPDAPRTYTSFSAAGDEQAIARVYQGVHFPNSVRVGEAMGRALSHYMVTNLMQPVQRGGDVNQDGRIDLKDVVLALEASVGGLTLSPPQQDSADLDANGSVDLTDVTRLLARAVGL